jgi:hypothetical protein
VCEGDGDEGVMGVDFGFSARPPNGQSSSRPMTTATAFKRHPTSGP